ncbi:glucose-1-phosphate cytidylyltransferase [Paenibacillus mucilaginosus]|uniref:Nucleotidyl transferase n=2 Tax=Paenibacillus mucilaginosus TaxID=61624 RepID=H6NAY8_9BACL|nr:glucose-1-phosphate cytidylyltransferase [Paenibacillus mucilaginosus]AEI43601.1 nucleotidyl transferase [Paenibacillus mucilaginosus KNP414]AFC31243.1 nucleotidyl transferase [Paenibacillus mucilaginosus 3016]MCG7216748.1 glucose-1-phosphate cytidylyltransferase [Paenibacillus mucilaginosus]WDM25136.1 glucose-1-phosphate cytidylyltransferase [Paenibacillus mucilaginosus]WFA19808.1 glucose-1-phosphate cytidylyltransferase [Paenibacillus mucilaginosus]
MLPVVLLAGGFGTRLSEETALKPKPLVEIGGRPILCHIMEHYSRYGMKEFYVALGYKGDCIKQFFLNYPYLQSDVTVRLGEGHVQVTESRGSDWTVHLRDTGLHTTTGGRLYRLRDRLRGGTFLMSYGDGVSSVNLRALLDYHYAQGKLATVTAVRPRGRFGTLTFEGERVTGFKEKEPAEESWINGGFFVFEPGVLDYLEDDRTELEGEVLGRLARDGQLAAYKHRGFWECMDTLRDKRYLEELWDSGSPPWVVEEASAAAVAAGGEAARWN